MVVRHAPRRQCVAGGLTKRVESVGFARRGSAPRVLYSPEWECRLVVYDDDFAFLSPRSVGGRVASTMKEWHEVKLRAIAGAGPESEGQVTILSRVLRWGPRQMVVEADPAHAMRIVEAMSLQEDAGGLEAPEVPVTVPVPVDEDQELLPGEAS